MNMLHKLFIFFQLIQYVKCLNYEISPTTTVTEGNGQTQINVVADNAADIGPCNVLSDNNLAVALPSVLNFATIGQSAQVDVIIFDNDLASKDGTSTTTVVISCQGGSSLDTVFEIIDNDLPFTASFPSEVTEGDSDVLITLQPMTPGGVVNFNSDCQFQLSPPGQIFFNLANPVHLSAGISTDIKLFIINDAMPEPNVIVTLEIRCPPTHPIPQMTHEITVKDNDAIVSGDPHFTQLVVDSRTGKSRRVCYDVTGEANNHILIYKHLQSRTSVYGKLLDDYYMHEVKILLMMNNITVTTKSIIIDNHTKFEWKTSDDLEWFKVQQYLIKFGNNVIEIETMNKRFSKVTFEIRRSYSDFGNMFLDVNVKGMTNYNGISGLLGHIGNSHFEFFDTIAKDEERERERRSIKVNDHLSVATRTIRNGIACWLVSVKDVVYPKKIEDFVN